VAGLIICNRVDKANEWEIRSYTEDELQHSTWLPHSAVLDWQRRLFHWQSTRWVH